MSKSKRGQSRTNRETLAELEKQIASRYPTMPPKEQSDEGPAEPYTSPHLVRMHPRGRHVVRKAKRAS